MTYGKSKERDMVRSILPSTARKGARENKRLINHKRRHAVKQALRQHRDALAHEGYFDPIEFEGETYDYYDDAWDYDAPDAKIADADGKYNSEISYAIWDRRGADKVAPIIRWAEAQVQDIRLLDRLTWLQAKMPDNLAVRHAISHIEFSDAFMVPGTERWWWRNPQAEADRAWIKAAEYAQAVEDLHRICTGPLGRFNKFIPKAVYRYDYTGGYNSRVNRQLQAPWRLVAERKALEPYWDVKRTWALDIERLQGVHHIEEWIAFIDQYKWYTRGMIERAIRMTYESTAQSYWTFDERSRHGRKEKV